MNYTLLFDSCGFPVHLKYLLRREHLMSLLSFSVIISKYMARVIIAIPSYPWITSNHILFFRLSIIIPKSKVTKQRYDELELNLFSLFYQLNVVLKQFVLMIERK